MRQRRFTQREVDNIVASRMGREKRRKKSVAGPDTQCIEIQRNETSNPIVYRDVINAYTKGPMYCVLFLKDGERVTRKFPLCSLFRVVEMYPESKR